MLWVELKINFLAYQHFDKLKREPEKGTVGLVGCPQELEDDFCDFLFVQNKFFPSIADANLFIDYHKLLNKYAHYFIGQIEVIALPDSKSVGMRIYADCTALNEIKIRYHEDYLAVLKFICWAMAYKSPPADIVDFAKKYFPQHYNKRIIGLASGEGGVVVPLYQQP